MKLSASRTGVWGVSIEDQPGGLAAKLDALADAGTNLELIIARRTPERTGEGVVFVAPVQGAKQVRAAQNAGFQETESLHSIRIEGMDKPGLGAAITRAVSDAGVNLRGLSAAAIGRKFVCYLALDSPEDATKALAAVKKLTK